MQAYDKFRSDGYLVFPNVLSEAEVHSAREAFFLAKEKAKTTTLTAQAFLTQAALTNQILNSKVLEYLREILGQEIYVYPNFTVRESCFIPWHNDAQFIRDCSDEGVDVVQCTIYLQDNNSENGGGITLVPKSHHLYRKGYSISDIGEDHAIEVKSRAGDLVVWDPRISHRSTECRVSGATKKLAIQWTVSGSETYTAELIDVFRRRSQQALHVADEVEDRPLDYLREMQSVIFPSSFPNYMITKANEEAVKLLGFQ